MWLRIALATMAAVLLTTTAIRERPVIGRTLVTVSAPWKSLRVLVTAYVVNVAEIGKCSVYTGRTSTGTVPQRGTVAVDHSTFPYGTRFNIPGYGHGVARDSGSAVNGRHIDVVVDTCAEAFHWGARHIKVQYVPTK